MVSMAAERSSSIRREMLPEKVEGRKSFRVCERPGYFSTLMFAIGRLEGTGELL